jgi:hypothetical protein
MYGDDIREAVDARELRVWTEDLWDTAADVRVEREDTRPGILKILLVLSFICICSLG